MDLRPLALTLAMCWPTAGALAQDADAATPGIVVDAPVVVVIEASGTRYDASFLRHHIGEEIDQPVISVIEAAGNPTHGTLAVAVTAGGREAAINFIPSDGTRHAVMLEVRATSPTDAYGEWLVAPCAAAIRTSIARRRATLESLSPTAAAVDPWISAHAATSGSEATDPTVGSPRRRVRVALVEYHFGDEIVNPWTDAVEAYRAEQHTRVERHRASAAHRR